MTDKVLCPWCGHEMEHIHIEPFDGHHGAWFKCGKCGAMSPTAYSPETKENAIEAARAAAMVEESEITRRAREEAARITEEARADANEQKIAAAHYADEILHELELTLQDNVDAVHKSRQNLGRKAR